MTVGYQSCWHDQVPKKQHISVLCLWFGPRVTGLSSPIRLENIFRLFFIYLFFKAYGSNETSVLLYGGGNVTRAATDIAGKKDDISVLGKSLLLKSPTPDIAYGYLLHCHKKLG